MEMATNIVLLMKELQGTGQLPGFKMKMETFGKRCLLRRCHKLKHFRMRIHRRKDIPPKVRRLVSDFVEECLKCLRVSDICGSDRFFELYKDCKNVYKCIQDKNFQRVKEILYKHVHYGFLYCSSEDEEVLIDA